MSRWHFTQHGSRRSGDSLDVLGAEADLLRDLFEGWSANQPDSAAPDQAVPAKWDRGTIGKLMLEHAAVHLAAREDIARALAEAGARAEASKLGSRIDDIRPVVDQMDEVSRGVEPISLAISEQFIDAVARLRDLLGPDLEAESGGEVVGRLAAVLGADRQRLRDAKYIRRHAPSHPGPRRWYSRVPTLVRLHAGYDRMRGFPWAESTLADTKLAERYDEEV